MGSAPARINNTSDLYHNSAVMEAVGGSGVACDWVEARDTLRQWREEDVRKSTKTVELGEFLMKHRKSDLGNEGTVLVQSLSRCRPFPFFARGGALCDNSLENPTLNFHMASHFVHVNCIEVVVLNLHKMCS